MPVRLTWKAFLNSGLTSAPAPDDEVTKSHFSLGHEARMGMGLQQWLFFILAQQRYGIRARFVREMTTTRDKHIKRIATAPDHVAGVVLLRNTVLPVFDLRSLLGMKSMADETEEVLQLLRDRERDHVNWLTELRAAVDEERPFTLATDPHKCAFGKWYDKVISNAAEIDRITNGEAALARVFKEFDDPHRVIHGIAHKVTSLISEHQLDAARNLIADTKDKQLARMIRLFGEAREMIRLSRHPLLIEIEHDGVQIALLVDAVDNVCNVDEDRIDTSGVTRNRNPYIHGFVVEQGKKGERPVTLLELESLVQATAC